MSINKILNFKVVETTPKQTTDFFERAQSYFMDRLHLRGYKELLNDIKELSGSSELTNQLYLLAFSDSIACGLSWSYLKDDVIKIPIFIVDAGFREIGIGDYLFNSILSHNIYKDAKTFESQVLPGDRNAKNFFEQHAGKTRELIVQGIITDAKTEQ